ncbi:MAG: hypothetical protein RLY23_1162 [Actinomycetota bacterium]
MEIVICRTPLKGYKWLRRVVARIEGQSLDPVDVESQMPRKSYPIQVL